MNNWPPQNEELYRQGVAVGQSNIRNDAITFRWRDEVYEFPTIEALRVAKYNNYFYVAKVKALRKLYKELRYGRIQ